MVKTKIKPIHGYQLCPFCSGNLDYAGISSGHIFPWIYRVDIGTPAFSFPKKWM